jgi:hypothetical protein
VVDSSTVILALCVSSIFVVVPFFVGIALLRKESALAHFAGWLTLKPVLGTGLLVLSAFWIRTGQDERWPLLLYLLMVMGLTALIVGAFRSVVFRPRAYTAWTLLVLDVARWGSTLSMTLIPYGRAARGTIYGPLGSGITLLALAMPTLFAIVAAVMCRRASPTQWEPSESPRFQADQ